MEKDLQRYQLNSAGMEFVEWSQVVTKKLEGIFEKEDWWLGPWGADMDVEIARERVKSIIQLKEPVGELYRLTKAEINRAAVAAENLGRVLGMRYVDGKVWDLRLDPKELEAYKDDPEDVEVLNLMTSYELDQVIRELESPTLVGCAALILGERCIGSSTFVRRKKR